MKKYLGCKKQAYFAKLLLVACILNAGVIGLPLRGGATGLPMPSTSGAPTLDIIILATILQNLTKGQISTSALRELVTYLYSLGFSSLNDISKLASNPNLLVADLEWYLTTKGLAISIDDFLNQLKSLAVSELSSLEINWANVTTVSDLLKRELPRLGINNFPDLVSYSFKRMAAKTGQVEYYELEKVVQLMLKTLEIKDFDQLSVLDNRLSAMGVKDFSLVSTLETYVQQQRAIYLAKQQTSPQPAPNPTAAQPTPPAPAPNPTAAQPPAPPVPAPNPTAAQPPAPPSAPTPKPPKPASTASQPTPPSAPTPKPPKPASTASQPMLSPATTTTSSSNKPKVLTPKEPRVVKPIHK